MKFNTTKAVIATVLVTAFAGISATAIAQGMGGMHSELHAQHTAQRGQHAPAAGDAKAMEQHQAQRQQRMQKRHAEHMAQLKAELKITAAQEAAWNAFVARSAPEPRSLQAGAPLADWSQLTTPQRLDQMQAHKAERDAAFAKRIDATKSFYAALTPEQQKVFDTQRHGGFHRAGMKGEHRMDGKAGKGGHSERGGHHGMKGGMGCDDGGMKGPGA